MEMSCSCEKVRTWAVAATMMVIVALCACVRVWAESDDAAFLEGLRSRRMFTLAERYCLERLNQQELPPDEQAKLAVELIRTYALHAVHAPPKDRDALWQAAHDTAAEFDRLDGGSPSAVLVRVQDALTVLARGEFARQETELAADDGTARQRARDIIREAARRLEELDEEIAALRRTRPPRGGEGALSADELFALHANVRRQTARAFRNQALCYDAGTNDRIASLTRALALHEQLLRELAADDPLRQEVRVDQAVCHRLADDFDSAARSLASVEADSATPRVRLAAQAEAARLELARGEPNQALQVLKGPRTIDSVSSPQRDMAFLETCVALWRAASASGNESESTRWREESLAAARAIEESHGAYWGRLADRLLVREAVTTENRPDFEILIRRADDLYVQKKWDEAVAAYDLAGDAARKAGDGESAFELFYKAALVDQQLARHDAARDRLRSVALANSSSPRAAEAHLLAAWNAAQVAQDDSLAVDAYVSILSEHVATWPESPTSDTARLWLGRLFEHQQKWFQAAEAYGAISSEAQSFDEAVAASARATERWLAERKAQGEALEEEASRAAQHFDDLLFDRRGQLPEQFGPAARNAALASARLRLLYTRDGHATAAALLEAALSRSPDAPQEWQSSVRSMLVVALAAQPQRRSDAAALLKQIGESSPSQLLEVLVGLSDVGQSASDDAQSQIARLQLEAAERLWPDRGALARGEQIALRRIRAEALDRSGNRAEAAAEYAKLAADEPDDAAVQVGYGRFLLAGGDRESAELALAQWRRVAARSRPNTETWYEAKYSVALAQFQLGRNDEAARLIRYLQITPPGLEGSPWNDKFLALLKRCEP